MKQNDICSCFTSSVSKLQIMKRQLETNRIPGIETRGADKNLLQIFE